MFFCNSRHVHNWCPRALKVAGFLPCNQQVLFVIITQISVLSRTAEKERKMLII